MAKRSKLELTWYNKDKALIPLTEGKYGYAWVEPTDPRYCQTRPLIIDEHFTGEQAEKDEKTTYSERADLTPQDDNLLILGESGDVLEALTRVPELVDKYVGQVKCIYIDPPFNTAQTFANYEDNLEHSVWLTMMRDRLLNMRNLLSDEGSIWVHLDNVENHRMRVLLDEVFGKENFIAEIVWERVDNASQRDSQSIVPSHDYIAVYGKKAPYFVANRQLLQDVPGHFNKRDEDGNWYCLRTLRKTGSDSTRESSPKMWFEITAPDGSTVLPVRSDGSDGRWRWSKRKVDEEYELLDWLPDKSGQLEPFTRIYFTPGKGVSFHDSWRYTDVGTNRISKAEITSLFPVGSPFTTPKPERLLERVIHIATNPGDIVFDCFAGSGTTAAVAQKMGRRWVTCELVEDTFNSFTVPRLSKVISNDDPGGVTFTNDREAKDGVVLPDKFDTNDAEDSAKLLRALAKMDHITPEQQAHIKETMKLIATKKSTVRNWCGGGGFTTAHLAPECFTYDPDLGLTTLTDAAEGDVLVRTIAANLGFYLSPEDSYFDGHYNRKRLAVVDGLVDKAKVDEVMSHLPEGCSADIAATMVDEDMRDYVSSFENGSRVIHIPFGVFPHAPVQPAGDENIELVESASDNFRKAL